MANPFDTQRMAEGYARARPAVHPHVIRRIRDRLRLQARLERALDIGCGAGLSTEPLSLLARAVIGLEPSHGMLRWSPVIAPEAHFAVAAAESLPVRSASVDLITAAGSLNWADLDRFFPEARRVLAPGGTLVVYDFGQGSDLQSSSALSAWHAEFKRRYPSPPCLALSPELFEANPPTGFRVEGHERFEVALEMAPAFYLEYAMTETNVAAAVERGEAEAAIREWCEQTLAPVFQGRPQQVLFKGYIAYLQLR